MKALFKLQIMYTLICVLSLLSLTGCDESSPTKPQPEPPVVDWEVLIVDPDDSAPVNLDSLSVIVTDSSLIFRMVTHGKWTDPWTFYDGLNAAILLDTDTNPLTGLSETSTYHYTPNDIGADFAIIIGMEGDALFSWDPGLNQWVNPLELTSLKLEPDTCGFEAEVHLAALFNPDQVDVVAATVCSYEINVFYDFGPDSGHATIDLGSGIASTFSDYTPRPQTHLHQPPVTAWR